tara:strand:- start:482 stop:628 length:147 start_codon:yes stop_codon:yes gene_type:complete
MEKLRELETIILQEQGYYDKDDDGHWGYYNAYRFVLKQINILLKENNK